MDGSAEDFTEMIERAGVIEQPPCVARCGYGKKSQSRQGARRISVEPAELIEDCLIDFTHPLIGRQHLHLRSRIKLRARISAARTSASQKR